MNHDHLLVIALFVLGGAATIRMLYKFPDLRTLAGLTRNFEPAQDNPGQPHEPAGEQVFDWAVEHIFDESAPRDTSHLRIIK